MPSLAIIKKKKKSTFLVLKNNIPVYPFLIWSYTCHLHICLQNNVVILKRTLSFRFRKFRTIIITTVQVKKRILFCHLHIHFLNPPHYLKALNGTLDQNSKLIGRCNKNKNFLSIPWPKRKEKRRGVNNMTVI